jgi:sugar-specific transcriptional regulator TrmB
MIIGILKKLGFSEKAATIYMTLLRLGPASVRAVATTSGLNRGVVYESLKWLQEEGLVDFYEKENKQFFVAEDPAKLELLARRQESVVHEAGKQVASAIPELRSLYNKGGEQPVARYFEREALGALLEDVLKTCEESGEKRYRIYSAASIREYLYDAFPTFSDVRISKGIAVEVIAIGEGGELRGLDECKWLRTAPATPTYIIIYPGKTAYISLNAKQEPIGVVIENAGVSDTQKVIFDHVWQSL